ncbi:MAG TPA: AraC family transcriptional regulator ligand-binding domain-containing protein [Pseudosphingobacterium sp.]|nr:AraC family transcriptional regulator ligand-binding domain-containing protein [Pseudosphingobacterium sp.]
MQTDYQPFILALLAYAAQRDISPEKLCQLADIELDKLKTGQQKSLRQTQIDHLWLNVINLTNDPLFGLHFGESLQLSALGVVGELIKSSDTVGKAVSIAATLVHLITPLIGIRITHHESAFTIHFDGLGKPQERQQICNQTLDLLMVFVIHELDGLILEKIRPINIKYKSKIHEKNLKEYERVMRCQPQLSKLENSITFSSLCWNEPILSSNYELQRILVQQHQALLTQPSLDKAFHTKIFNYLLANSYLGLVSIEQIAANFNVSARTLQRRLKLEGTSFQQVADEARKTLSIQYLSAGEYSVKQVSHMLGYNEISAFTRTFKRWTGMAPTGFRKQ